MPPLKRRGMINVEWLANVLRSGCFDRARRRPKLAASVADAAWMTTNSSAAIAFFWLMFDYYWLPFVYARRPKNLYGVGIQQGAFAGWRGMCRHVFP